MADDDEVLANGQTYDATHTDHMGAKTLTYTHDTAPDGATVISMSHDAVPALCSRQRELAPVRH